MSDLKRLQHLTGEFHDPKTSVEVSFARLGERLFEILRGRADKGLFIEASEELPFGSVVKVIDVAKGALTFGPSRRL